MVSNAARLIIAEAEAKGSNLHDLADYAAVQINDPHQSMVDVYKRQGICKGAGETNFEVQTGGCVCGRKRI